MGRIIKKLPLLALCIACLLGLAACGSSQPAASSSASGSSEAASSEASSSSSGLVPTNQLAIGEKALVVYYSATGNTMHVAAEVSMAADADLYIVEPTVEYTEEDLNYEDPNSRVYREHADPALQDVELVSTTVPDWSSYDTVFLGYPIWWGEAAWPLASFVKANDFTGKNVVCFCTSNTSGIGDSVEQLRDLATGGTWSLGERFPEGATQEEVDKWIETFILEMND